MSDFPKVRGVLFDLDGTLLDTHNLILASFRHAVKAVLGCQIPDERLMAKVGQPLAVQMWDFTSDQEVHDELLRVYREHNEKVHDDLIRIFPDVPELVVDLKRQGIPFGVVTSKRHDAAVRGLATFGLDGAVDLLIGSDDCASHKPDPGPVLQGCQALALQPAECAYVGDSPFDMQAGNGAGCPTIAVLWGMFSEAVLRVEKPDAVCQNVAELRALLPL